MDTLERMAAFFDARLADYDAHMLNDIAGAGEFYPFTASLLPRNPGAEILDLGCGTGLELQWYFLQNPSAQVTGIDLAPGMLERLREKFPGKRLQLICGSYFDVPFPGKYDGAVSVESLHHFSKEEKIPLYRKLWEVLKPGGFFILTDYFALTETEERLYRQNLLQLKREQGLRDTEFYHYDTPLTLENELSALYCAGFSQTEILRSWGATHTIKAYKGA